MRFRPAFAADEYKLHNPLRLLIWHGFTSAIDGGEDRGRRTDAQPRVTSVVAVMRGDFHSRRKA